MIEKEQENLHFILHDSPEPPRLLVVSRQTLGRFTLWLPLAVTGSLLLLLGLAWFRAPSITPRLRTIGLPKLPQLTSGNDKVKELELEIESLKASQAAIQTKLSTGVNSEADIWLGPIKRPYALQDLTSKKLLRLEEVTVDSDSGQVVFRSNLINTRPESQRVTGHFFVLQLHGQGIALYPVPKVEDLAAGLRFDQGETFAVSRLRPIEAPFPNAPNARYLILAFSREGDLLMREELTGPFKTPGNR